MHINVKAMKIPRYLSHYPIVGVDYEEKDAHAGDAKFLSLGLATWAKGYKDYSAKVFRLTHEGEDGEKWSRQSEELPLWRVLDLAILLVAQIQNVQSSLHEEMIGSEEEHEELKAFLRENYKEYMPRLMELKRLLLDGTKDKDINTTPNIFDFATSELSQDAILTWILSWADPSMKKKDESLHNVAQELVRTLLHKNDSFIVNSITVGRQWQNIDIWAEINEDIFLIIEDKTKTTIHDNQLERYQQIATEHYKESRAVHCAYVKTGNETKKIIDQILKTGYSVFERPDIIKCLSNYSGNSDLVWYFNNHLLALEEKTNSYKILPFTEWCWEAWEGFYKELERNLDIYDWSYVSNPSGGFLGIWWHFIPFEDINHDPVEMYLQIEQPEKLCIKISFDGERDLRSEVRWKYHQLLFETAKELNLNVHDPARFGNGNYMTIGVVDLADILGSGGTYDPNKTITKLKEYERLVSTCREKLL